MTIEIERCRLAYQCTQRWEALEPVVDKPRARFCSQCQSAVHLATTTDEFDALARQGKCVAFLHRDDMLVGAIRRIPNDD